MKQRKVDIEGIAKLSQEQKKILEAIKNQDLIRLKSIVAEGVAPNFSYDNSDIGSPLYLAVFKNDLEIVKYLLPIVDVDEEDAHYFALCMDRMTISSVVFNYLRTKEEHPKK